jgi:hypothetical protein
MLLTRLKTPWPSQQSQRMRVLMLMSAAPAVAFQQQGYLCGQLFDDGPSTPGHPRHTQQSLQRGVHRLQRPYQLVPWRWARQARHPRLHMALMNDKDLW